MNVDRQKIRKVGFFGIFNQNPLKILSQVEYLFI